MNKDLTTYRLIIIGRVQDVGFRYWFSKLAISLDLNGYIQNQKNINEVAYLVKQVLEDKFTTNKFEYLQTDVVGPQVTQHFIQSGVKAIIFALLGVAIYVWIKFFYK